MRLFIERGYAETTLEMVAEEAGIARRTFFSYFKSKDEIVLARERDGWHKLLDEIREISPDKAPLMAVRDVILDALESVDDTYLKAVVKIKACSPALVAARHASFAEREQLLYAALRDVWPQNEHAAPLRMMAMVTVGALRVAAEAWEAPGNRRSLRHLFGEAISSMSSLLSPQEGVRSKRSTRS